MSRNGAEAPDLEPVARIQQLFHRMIAGKRALGSRGAADLDLLKRWRTGDTRAGERLCERYFDLLWRFFHHRAPNDAADLIQRTMLGCVESMHRDIAGGNVRAYLLGIARRVLFQHYERERVRRVDPLAVSPVDDVSNSARSMLAMREDQRQLACALRRLPLDLQLVVELMYWEELPLAEIATVVEVPVGTVKSRLDRARRLLAQALEGRGPASNEPPTADLADWVHSVRWFLDRTSTPPSLA